MLDARTDHRIGVLVRIVILDGYGVVIVLLGILAR